MPLIKAVVHLPVGCCVHFACMILSLKKKKDFLFFFPLKNWKDSEKCNKDGQIAGTACLRRQIKQAMTIT